MKTLIAIPTSRDIEIQCAASIIGMEREGRIGVFCPQSYSIDASRNLIVEHALEIGYDYIMWIDSDMILPKNTLTTLMSHDKDVVSGVYAYKLIGAENAVTKRFKDKAKDIYEDIPLKEITESKRLIEVDGVGFGCVLTKVDVFRHIKKPWFRYTPNMGEDIYFCRKAQKAGYQVYLDTSILCGHVGSVNYNIKEAL
jgi:GT2 family glycosyltransferase